MDFAVLVLSSDKYSHIWPGFFKAWGKYFPDCKWPVYLGSNTIPYAAPGVTTLLSGGDPDWSTSLCNILDQIQEKRLFLILEDLLLASPMDARNFSEAVEFMAKDGAKHIKYYLPFAPDADVPGRPFGVYAKGRPYRSSVVAFWDKDTLRSLLIPGENPWNFEIMSSYRCSYQDGFYMMKNTLCRFSNMIERGQWYPSAVEWAKHEGLDIGQAQRTVLTGGLGIKSRIQSLVYRVICKVPWKVRLKMMNALRKLLVCY